MNVVSTAELGQQVDLGLLNKHAWGRYDLDIYPAGYLKDGWMLGQVTVFHTGKMISVGANSIKSSLNNLDRAMVLLLSAKLIESVKIKPKVRNIVASVDLEGPLDLHALVRSSPRAIYEPEQFPGVIMKSKGESISFLIFASGKAVVAGAKTLAELRFALRRLKEMTSRERQ